MVETFHVAKSGVGVGSARRPAVLCLPLLSVFFFPGLSTASFIMMEDVSAVIDTLDKEGFHILSATDLGESANRFHNTSGPNQFPFTTVSDINIWSDGFGFDNEVGLTNVLSIIEDLRLTRERLSLAVLIISIPRPSPPISTLDGIMTLPASTRFSFHEGNQKPYSFMRVYRAANSESGQNLIEH